MPVRQAAPSSSRRLPRVLALLAGLVATTSAIGSLTACASEEGAVQAAQTYLDLVADGGTNDLETLWAMSVADPVAGRLAGELLPGAVERIEVLEVGSPVAVDDARVDVLYSDVVERDAVQITVRYELAGDEHEGTIVLAPRQDAARADPASWRIVTPLTGDLLVSLAGAEVQSAVMVSGHWLPLERPADGDRIPLFPGVYDVQLRGDPYLASDVGQVTIQAGREASVPGLQLEATGTTIEAVQTSAEQVLGECASERAACPEDISTLALETGDDWQATLTTVPTIAVDEARAPFGVVLAGGELLVQTPTGAETWTFSGTGDWYFDIDAQAPALRWWTLELQVTR